MLFDRPGADQSGPRVCTIGRLCALVFIATLVAFIWLSSDFVLSTAASSWIVSDRVSSADAVVVLGGDVRDRPFAGAEYYRVGLTRRILVSNTGDGQASINNPASDMAKARDILVNAGVPPSAIVFFGNDLKSTYQEALALRSWADQNRVSSLIVPTEFFSARRVRWTLHRVFGSKFAVRVVAINPPQYTPADWWHHKAAFQAFATEVAKYLYYRLRY